MMRMLFKNLNKRGALKKRLIKVLIKIRGKRKAGKSGKLKYINVPMKIVKDNTNLQFQ